MLNFRALRVGGQVLKEILSKHVSPPILPHGYYPFSVTPKRGAIPPGTSGHTPGKPPVPPKKFPELLYFPKFFRWLGMKIRLKYLKRVWDPEFSEGAFIYGSTQAICRISEIVHFDKPNELRSLLTDQAEKQLRADMLGKLTHIQRKVILLKPTDIKLLVPIKVQLITDKENRKLCLVMLKSLSMKWYQENQNLKLVLIVIDTEFTREYTQGNKSEWFVSLFKIVQCALINGSAGPPKPQA